MYSAPGRQTNRLEFPTIVLPLSKSSACRCKFWTRMASRLPGLGCKPWRFTNRFLPLPGLLEAEGVVPVFGQSQGSTQTDGNGRFSFDAVCEGIIQLNVSFQGSSVNVQTVGGNTNIVLRLDLSNVNVREGAANSDLKSYRDAPRAFGGTGGRSAAQSVVESDDRARSENRLGRALLA